MAAKRQYEKLIQGWFDPAKPGEESVIRALEAICAKYSWSQKEAIGYSLLFYQENKIPEVEIDLFGGSQAQKRLEESVDMLRTLVDTMRESAQQGAWSARSAYDTDNPIERISQQLTELEQGIGEHYHSLPYIEIEDE